LINLLRCFPSSSLGKDAHEAHASCHFPTFGMSQEAGASRPGSQAGAWEPADGCIFFDIEQAAATDNSTDFLTDEELRYYFSLDV
jgi:hypothetical protein